MTFGQWLDANVATAEANRSTRSCFRSSMARTRTPPRCCSRCSRSTQAAGSSADRYLGRRAELTLRGWLAGDLAADGPPAGIARDAADTGRSIDQTSSKHVLVRSGTEEFVARRVIVAMTPQDANRIRYAPTLTTQRIILQKMWPIGTGWKTFAVYKKPFWRAQGLNGQAITDLPAALYTADNSPPDGSPGVLLSFFGTANQTVEFGGSPQQLNDPGARRGAVLAALATSSASRRCTRSHIWRRTGRGNPGSPDARPQCPRGADEVHIGADRSSRPDPLGRHRDSDNQRRRDRRGGARRRASRPRSRRGPWPKPVLDPSLRCVAGESR